MRRDGRSRSCTTSARRSRSGTTQLRACVSARGFRAVRFHGLRAFSSPGSSRPGRLRDDAILPARAYEGDAGLDLAACEAVTLRPGERATVPTGIAVEIPPGYA